MWTLFRNVLMPFTRVDEAQQALREEIARSQQVQQEISKMMAQMAELGHQNTPEYRDVMAAYQNLSHLIADASKELKTKEAKDMHEQRATADLDARFDLTGIKAIKATLGAAGRRGIVSEGAEVTNLQKFLTAVGFPTTESGKFDVPTRQTVQQFQSKYGLHQEPQVGAEMRRVINDMIKGR